MLLFGQFHLPRIFAQTKYSNKFHILLTPKILIPESAGSTKFRAGLWVKQKTLTD